MSYIIDQIQETRESFGPYRYKIFKDNQEVAIYWHDYRGDSMGIIIRETGFEVDPPFGRCSDFVTGGGPQPLRLSKKAKQYLDSLINC